MEQKLQKKKPKQNTELNWEKGGDDLGQPLSNFFFLFLERKVTLVFLRRCLTTLEPPPSILYCGEETSLFGDCRAV